ncbi:MAG: aromatic-ring-hydroxylating dioxygenase subunit beta [Rugosibacter sp.]|nr:aromatic-ring-hydroxylating dioxygenase subunit beta [Rugosibacter sp.]
MDGLKAVAHDIYHEIEQTLYREARLICEERLREWLDTMIDQDILYQAVSRQLRVRKDSRYAAKDHVNIFNENYHYLAMRVTQSESPMQWTADPREIVRHFINNLEVYEGESPGEYKVFANCYVVRNRRIYEEMTYSYSRKDVWRKNAQGQFRLLKRLSEVDERFMRGKNLNFIL